MRRDLQVPHSRDAGAEGSGSSLARVEDLGKVVGGTYGPGIQRSLMRRNGTLCEQYVLAEGDELLGTLSVMYRGGNELEYRIRRIDAFIYNLAVPEAHRGRGIAGEMLRQVFDILADRGCSDVYLAVSADNASAIRAYEKAGFEVVGTKSFVRTLKINIPYHVL